MPPAHMRAVITDLAINGISIYEAENEQFLTKALNYTREISLPHDKNSLNIHFSNFDYPHIQNAMYQYYLEGIDNTWRPMTSINHAEFSDLNPGSYTLHIRTRIGSNQWSEETLLHITICQPWYNTVWAWCIYLLIIYGAGVLYYRSWLRNFELNQQIALEKQISDFRINFFTHISHEFRTPLAIIQSAVEKMMTKGEGNASKNNINTLSRGTKRLQRLINQLMEFRKINTGNMKLNVEKGEIIGFVRAIYNDLYTVAKQKDVTMNFTPWTSNHEMLFDQEKVETIVYNLLSNAVKYTPDKGIISVKLYLENNIVFFSVEDNGPGIKPEREADLFKPFMHGYASKGGMGIGLYTAHQMAEIHKGSLTYERSLDLGGSRFCLALPNDAGKYQPEDIIEKKAPDDHSIDKDEIEMIVKEMTPKAINNVTVMVIEDDPDMLEQIKSELSVYFHVETFMNGKTGYENIRKIKPALLISDIQLPEMIARALQFVAMELKAKQQAEEKAQQEKALGQETTLKENAPLEKAEQSSCGEVILVKPVKELKKNEPTLLMSTLDKKFKDKLEAIVAQHIGDNNFNVDRLAELLCLGRTTVYNRTKSIMGVSPNIYIQNERLRIAAKLLLEGEYTVSEISEKVGFSDSTYFYKCFKNKFGIAPSKYGK
jgi:signal transduction histidine kinase/AraC-like DNA-binding protein